MILDLGDARNEPGGCDGVAAKHRHPTLQRPARSVRTPVSGALQGTDCKRVLKIDTGGDGG